MSIAPKGLKHKIALLPYPVFLGIFDALFFLRSRSRARYVMLRTGIPSIEECDLKGLKRSDVLFVLGSGSSINQIAPERWQVISTHDTVGFNFWLYHPFVPTFYFFENIDLHFMPTMTQAFLKIASERAADYINTPKVIMDLHKFGPTTAFELPESWKQDLYGVRSSLFPARDRDELAYGLSHLVRKGVFTQSERIDTLFKYCSTLTSMVSLAVRLGYRKIVLCGVDLKDSRYFFQDADFYPQTENLEFVRRTQPHLTDVPTAWRVPVSTVLMEMKRQVLEPAGIEIYVESRDSALFPQIPEAPASIFRETGCSAREVPVTRPRALTVVKRPRRMPGILSRGLIGIVRRIFFEEQWFIVFAPRNKQSLLDRTEEPWQINPPSGHFYADPFLLTWQGRDYVFFEDYEYRNSKGVISCLEITEPGSWTAPIKVLEQKYHLSYPCVFEWENEIYMIPETSKNLTIELYRAVEFPCRWRFERVLVAGVAASDSTLFKDLNGKFWLLTSIASGHDPNLGPLHAFISESPLGEWVGHRMNPIVADELRSRPAGQLFWHEGQLFRPSQDCSAVYGQTIILNRVDVLSENEYRETPVTALSPDWLPGSYRTHTINRTDRFEVRDTLRYVLRQDWLNSISRRIRRMVHSL